MPAITAGSYVKILRDGERFWCEVKAVREGSVLLRCDNYTAAPEAPRYGDEFTVGMDEYIYDRHPAKPSTIN